MRRGKPVEDWEIKPAGKLCRPGALSLAFATCDWEIAAPAAAHSVFLPVSRAMNLMA